MKKFLTLFTFIMFAAKAFGSEKSSWEDVMNSKQKQNLKSNDVKEAISYFKDDVLNKKLEGLGGCEITNFSFEVENFNNAKVSAYLQILGDTRYYGSLEESYKLGNNAQGWRQLTLEIVNKNFEALGKRIKDFGTNDGSFSSERDNAKRQINKAYKNFSPNSWKILLNGYVDWVSQRWKDLQNLIQ